MFCEFVIFGPLVILCYVMTFRIPGPISFEVKGPGGGMNRADQEVREREWKKPSDAGHLL